MSLDLTADVGKGHLQDLKAEIEENHKC